MAHRRQSHRKRKEIEPGALSDGSERGMCGRKRQTIFSSEQFEDIAGAVLAGKHGAVQIATKLPESTSWRKLCGANNIPVHYAHNLMVHTPGLRSALTAWLTGRLAGTDDGWQAAFNAVDGGNDASGGAFDLELKLHIVVPIDHIRSYSAAAAASISEFAKSGALMAEATIRRQAAAFVDWYMTKEERLRHAHVIGRGDAMERLMAEHDNGVRRSRTQRLVVTSASAVNACNGGDGQLTQELRENPQLVEARVNAARKGAPKREAAEAEARKAIDAVKHERHMAARATAILSVAAAATKKAEAVIMH